MDEPTKRSAPSASEPETDTSGAGSASSGERPDRSADAPASLLNDDPLVVWALASFHTAALVAILVVALYLLGPVNWALSGLSTVGGLGLYLALWALTWWATRGVVRAVARAGADAAASVVLREGGKWGGVDGACFLWVLLVVVVVPGTAISDVTLEGVLLVLFYGGVGSVVALGVGGIVGVLFAALDLGLFRIARSLSPGVAFAADPEPESRDEAT